MEMGENGHVGAKHRRYIVDLSKKNLLNDWLCRWLIMICNSLIGCFFGLWLRFNLAYPMSRIMVIYIKVVEWSKGFMVIQVLIQRPKMNSNVKMTIQQLFWPKFVLLIIHSPTISPSIQLKVSWFNITLILFMIILKIL